MRDMNGAISADRERVAGPHEIPIAAQHCARTDHGAIAGLDLAKNARAAS